MQLSLFGRSIMPLGVTHMWHGEWWDWRARFMGPWRGIRVDEWNR